MGFFSSSDSTFGASQTFKSNVCASPLSFVFIDIPGSVVRKRSCRRGGMWVALLLLWEGLRLARARTEREHPPASIATDYDPETSRSCNPSEGLYHRSLFIVKRQNVRIGDLANSRHSGSVDEGSLFWRLCRVSAVGLATPHQFGLAGRDVVVFQPAA